MKRQLLFIVSAISILFLVGCSTNEIKVVNEAEGDIVLTFRGEEHEVAAGSSKIIDKIPDGTFAYGTTYEIPVGYNESEAEEGCAGKLLFVEHNTDYVLFYGSYYEDITSTDTSGSSTTNYKYIIHCNVSSSVPDEALTGN